MGTHHITRKGKAAPCTARPGKCPLAKSWEHYETLEEAVLASKSWEPPADEAAQEPPLTSAEFDNLVAIQKEPLSERGKHRAWPAFEKSLDRDPRGIGIHMFADPDGGDLAGMSDEHFNRLVAAQAKPMRLTPSEKKKADALMAEHGVTQDEVEAWAVQHANALNLTLRGQKVQFHPSRSVWALGEANWSHNGRGEKTNMGYNINTMQQVKDWKAARTPDAKNAAAAYVAAHPGTSISHRPDGSPMVTKPVSDGPDELYHDIVPSEEVQRWATEQRASEDKDPKHHYGAWAKKQEESKPERSSNKMSDAEFAAMIDKLKLKYLAEVKIPFDESGHTIPELLEMARTDNWRR